MSTSTSHIDDELSEFLRSDYKEALGEFVQSRSADHRSVIVDWMDLYRYDKDLADDLLEHPNEVQSAADKALREALLDLPVQFDANQYGDIHLRFANLSEGEVKGTGDTRSRHIGQYHELYGQVSKVSQIQPKVDVAHFECQRCGTMSPPIPQANDLQEPHECQGCERSGPFTLMEDESEWIDSQKVRIQEPPEETLGGQGAHLDVILEDDAVMPLTDGAFKPGNRVNVTGRYTVSRDGDSVKPYLDGDTVRVEEGDYEEIEISRQEKERIKEIANSEDPYQPVVDSLAPSHHGDSHIKLALALQMFRGVRDQRPDGSWTRGDSHILLLGDPGTGKSSLLRRMADVAPRSSYASGKGASAAGMTAAAVPSDFGDEKWDVQAGVLVLSTGGIACVDEIDKVQEDAVSSMHDALEAPQVVEVDKADIHTTLPAQTSLLAAGNPKEGRFNDFDPTMGQIDVSPTLLSRFDLMFLMTDEPNEDRDRELAESMIKSRQSAVRDVDDSDMAPPLSEEFLRKYVAYARQNVKPTIESDEVSSKLVDEFTRLRRQGYEAQNPVPITPRKLEAFQRLAEASARVRLSETVSVEDVERVTALIVRSLQELGVDEDGTIDADVIETGQSKTQRERKRTVRSIISQVQRDSDTGSANVERVLDKCEQEGIDRDRAHRDIKKLRMEGEAYEPSDGAVRLVD